MIIEVILKDDQGNIIGPVIKGPAQSPLQWKVPPANPFIIDRGNNSEGVSNGVYLFWGYTLTPMITMQLNYRKGV